MILGSIYSAEVFKGNFNMLVVLEIVCMTVLVVFSSSWMPGSSSLFGWMQRVNSLILSPHSCLLIVILRLDIHLRYRCQVDACEFCLVNNPLPRHFLRTTCG